MISLSLLIFLLIIFSMLPVIRTNLFLIYIIQLKEYRYDRLKEYFLSPNGKKVFFNKIFIIYCIIFAIYGLDYFTLNGLFFLYITKFLLLFMFIDNIYIIYKIYNGNLVFPKKTNRSFLLLIVLTCLQLIIFFGGFFIKHFFIALFLLFVCNFLILIFANILTIPFVIYKKNKIFVDAKRKIEIINKNINFFSIGVTGSFGKSSVKTFLYHILSKKYNTLVTPENINTEIGVSQFIVNSNFENTNFFIAEMGAYRKGEIDFLGNIVKHKFGFLTGIGNQHIGLFGNQNNIISAKWEINNSINKYGGKLYVNIDGMSKDAFGFGSHNNNIITYSIIRSDADAYSLIKNFDGKIIYFDFFYKKNKISLETNIFGKHNIINLTGVIAFCIDVGVDINLIKKNILDLSIPKSTLEINKIKKGLIMVDDSHNLSVEGLFSGIEYIQYMDGKKILVLDDIIELGKDSSKIHYDIGKKLSHFDLDKIFLVGTDYFKYLNKGLLDGGFDINKIYFVGDMSILKSEKNGIILLEGMHSGKFFKELF